MEGGWAEESDCLTPRFLGVRKRWTGPNSACQDADSAELDSRGQAGHRCAIGLAVRRMAAAAAAAWTRTWVGPAARCCYASIGLGSRARALSTATRLSQVRTDGELLEALVLRGDEKSDLMCVNMMCEHVGGPCACKLARTISRVPNLRRLEIPGHGLEFLPDVLDELSEVSRRSERRRGRERGGGGCAKECEKKRVKVQLCSPTSEIKETENQKYK